MSEGGLVYYGDYGSRVRGRVALGREGTTESFERLAEAMKKELRGDTVHNLVWEYLQSEEFTKLKSLTQRDYRRKLDLIRMKFGPPSLRAMSAREIAAHLDQWRDSMAASPRQADHAVTMLKTLLSYGVRRGRLDQNRALGIPALYKNDRCASCDPHFDSASGRIVGGAPRQVHDSPDQARRPALGAKGQRFSRGLASGLQIRWRRRADIQ